MKIEVKVPVLPESVTEGTLLEWHKQPGDAVGPDDNLLDLETDKVVLEVPAGQAGVLQEQLVAAGTTVTAGQPVAIIDTQAATAAAGDAQTSSQPAPPQAAEPEPAAVAPLTPAVRRLATEHGLDAATLATIAGSGKDGRLTKADVEAHLAGGAPGSSPVAQSAPPAGNPPTGPRPEERVPMTRIRKRIAERLLQAQHQAAMLTTFNEVNMQPVMDLRSRHREAFEKAHGVRLGFMSFFVSAACAALRRFPAVNASIDGDDIIYHGYCDIGIAVSSPRGLVVPILRDAEQRSFADIEQSIRDFGQRAQENKLAVEDLQGGTFSITNGGIFGSMLSTPIINPPQSAILGMHNIVERPVAEAGQVVIRPVMYLALSYDHRIIDGREAVSFLVAVKQALEDPARLLLSL